MKKYLLAFLILVFGNFMVPLNFSCYAIDEEGCLTCHQYPGLVRLEKSGEFSVLHIDEARYMRSPHGKLACRKCHVTVVDIASTLRKGQPRRGSIWKWMGLKMEKETMVTFLFRKDACIFRCLALIIV